MKEADLKVLTKQLGRQPRNLVELKQRCSRGYPQVVATAPVLTDQSPPGLFPTTYWLSCPELEYRISQLETAGWVKKLEAKLEAETGLAARLKQAHLNYRQSRLELVSEAELEQLKRNFPGQYRVLTESGIAGIQGEQGIKCLHAHYAHYLVDKNPIGELVDRLLAARYVDLAKTDCRQDCQQGGLDCGSEQ